MDKHFMEGEIPGMHIAPCSFIYLATPQIFYKSFYKSILIPLLRHSLSQRESVASLLF